MHNPKQKNYQNPKENCLTYDGNADVIAFGRHHVWNLYLNKIDRDDEGCAHSNS